MHGIQKAIADAAQKKQEEDINKDLEMRRQIIVEGYERAEKYTNIIILAGYVGIFSLWSLTKEYLDETLVMRSALMIGVSLATFIAWEVFKMFLSGIQMKKMCDILYASKLPSEIREDLLKVSVLFRNQNNRVHSFWWIMVLSITVISGFGGGFLLFYGFVDKIFLV